MAQRVVLPMTVFAVLTAAVFCSQLWADDGVVQMSRYPYYARQAPVRQQPVNPTYWTWMPCPLHGGCDTCWDHKCPGGKGIWTIPAVRWVLDPDYYAVAPDHGWEVPGKAPLVRRYSTYSRFHPENWYGAGNGGRAAARRRYPVIGQPTDTAQMGYSYQHVPTWQPQPAAIPGKPDPRNWHWRPNQVNKDGVRTRWVRLVDVWVPLDQIPGRTAPQPVPEPMPENAAPVPAPETAPQPAPGEPRALNEPADGPAIRRAVFQ